MLSGSGPLGGLLIVSTLAACSPVAASPESTWVNEITSSPAEKKAASHLYVGMWVTDDDHVRQALLANGRYDEARGTRESAYQGRYKVTGNRIDYWDDTGFTADGEFVDENTLHHGGMIFRRR